MPRVIIDRTAYTETLKLKDPDAALLLEFLLFRHGAGAFDIHDELRRQMPKQGGWTLTRFAGARGRLLSGLYLQVVRDKPRTKTAQHLTRPAISPPTGRTAPR